MILDFLRFTVKCLAVYGPGGLQRAILAATVCVGVALSAAGPRTKLWNRSGEPRLVNRVFAGAAGIIAGAFGALFLAYGEASQAATNIAARWEGGTLPAEGWRAVALEDIQANLDEGPSLFGKAVSSADPPIPTMWLRTRMLLPL